MLGQVSGGSGMGAYTPSTHSSMRLKSLGITAAPTTSSKVGAVCSAAILLSPVLISALRVRGRFWGVELQHGLHDLPDAQLSHALLQDNLAHMQPNTPTRLQVQGLLLDVSLCRHVCRCRAVAPRREPRRHPPAPLWRPSAQPAS